MWQITFDVDEITVTYKFLINYISAVVKMKSSKIYNRIEIDSKCRSFCGFDSELNG